MTLLVFLVEDDPLIRANLMDVMTNLLDVRFVGVARSQTAAVQWLEHHERAWDLAVVDLFLEEGTGFGVMTSMMLLPDWQHVVALIFNTRKSGSRLGVRRTEGFRQDR